MRHVRVWDGALLPNAMGSFVKKQLCLAFRLIVLAAKLSVAFLRLCWLCIHAGTD